MSIAMATYLLGIKGGKTAIVEVGNGEDFEAAEKLYFGQSGKERFSLLGIDYCFCGDMSGIGWLYNEGYEYMVIDFGADYRKYEAEVLRCSLKLVMGSVNLWRYGDYLELCSYIKKFPGSDRWLHIVSGDLKDIKAHLKKESLIGMERVMIGSPYIIENNHLDFFQKIL